MEILAVVLTIAVLALCFLALLPGWVLGLVVIAILWKKRDKIRMAVENFFRS